MPTAFLYQPHRRLAHPSVAGRPRAVNTLAPRQGRDITIFMPGFIRSKPHVLAERCAQVWVCTMIKQQPRKLDIPRSPA